MRYYEGKRLNFGAPTHAAADIAAHVAYPSRCDFSGYMVAVEEGFYTEECLDVAIRPGERHTPCCKPEVQ